ncbi:MAG: hypothetical protein K2Y29_18110 [Beijerinckiaceae bacterium]|nr:hypothetical protein [Beijerinckiaceae bacterium]
MADRFSHRCHEGRLKVQSERSRSTALAKMKYDFDTCAVTELQRPAIFAPAPHCDVLKASAVRQQDRVRLRKKLWNKCTQAWRPEFERTVVIGVAAAMIIDPPSAKRISRAIPKKFHTSARRVVVQAAPRAVALRALDQTGKRRHRTFFDAYGRASLNWLLGELKRSR